MRAGLLLVLTLGACLADDAFDDDANIPCAAQADCPGDFVCRPALERCVPADADNTLPAISGDALITPRVVGEDGDLHVEFSVSEALLEAPLVVMATNLGARPLSLEDESGLGYRFRYRLQGDEGEGGHTISATLIDALGNIAEDVVIGTVDIDVTSPTTTLFELTPDGGRLNREGVLNLRFQTSEPLTELPRVFLGGATIDVEPIELTVSRADDLPDEFDASYAATGMEPEDVLYVVRTVLVDDAGNVSPAQTSLGDVSFDFTAPFVGSFNITLTGGDDELDPNDAATVIFETNEDIGQEPLVTGECGIFFQLQAGSVQGRNFGYEYRWLQKPFIPPGPCVINVDLVDEAGNPATVPLDSIIISN